jgi:predicted TIM-barrel fold metal-dependent hydrolase
MRSYTYVSADSHLEVSPDQWRPYVDAEFRKYAPQVVKLDNGGDAWKMPGTDKIVPLGLNFFSTSKDPRQRWKAARTSGVSYAEGLYGAGDGHQRLKEQDMDGVDAEVLFPAVSGQRTLEGIPSEAYAALVRGYNDWLSQEFTAVDPDRLFGMAMIPATSIDDAVSELRRVATMPGIRGIVLHQWPNGSGAPDESDDRFWATALELNVPVTAHAVFGGGMAADPKLAKAHSNAVTFNSMLAAGGRYCYTQAQLISEGVLDRFPELVIYFAETGIQWIPGFMEMGDHEYERHRYWANLDFPMQPSEYIRRHFRWSFQQDYHGLRNRNDIGVDNIMWATDFPHMATNFPESRQLIKEQIAGTGLSQEEETKIFRDNCLDYFHVARA